MKISFNPKDFNRKVNNLLSNGYEEYLTVIEEGVTHVIMTNTNPKSEYNGSVVDLYDNGSLEYSGQFKTPSKPLV